MWKNWKIDQSLLDFGQHLKIARLKRRLPQSLVAERAGISVQTLRKAEAGDPGVSIRIVAGIMFALGFGTPFGSLCAPAQDELALELDEERLPKRIRRRKNEF